MSGANNLSSSTRATGELINIIKEIYYNTSGENTEERDRIIKKVDHQFADCDARVDKYIRSSSTDLSRLIKLFNEMARKIEMSRANVLSSREALKQCKLLLQSKRDDVRRLWLDWCEQKCFYASLMQLKNINNTTEMVNQMCAEKRYLEASEAIAKCSRQLNTDFSDLGALKDFNTVLAASRIKLETHLLDELNFQFYDSVTKSVLETGGSGMSGPNSSSMNKRRLFKPDLSSSLGDANSSWRSNTSNILTNTAPIEDMANGAETAVPVTSEQMIDRIVSAAAMLTTPDQLISVNIVEKLVEEINRELSNRLIKMVNVTSTHVVESNLINRTTIVGIENNPKFLGQLVELTFEQFKCMARLYRHFVESAISKLNATGATVVSVNKYPWTHVWACIQNVLMQLLDEYLDIRQLNQSQSSAEAIDKFDINSFFVRKRLINLGFGDSTPSTATTETGADNDEKDHHRVFTFKGSSHAMSISNYIREQNNENLFSSASESNNNETGTSTAAASEQRTFKILVCQPNNRNITSIFGVMEHIVKDIADELRSRGGASGDMSSQQIVTNSQGQAITTQQQQQQDMILERFLQDFILNTFVQNAVSSITHNAQIHSSVDGKYEISKQLISLQKQRELGLQRPILQSVLLVYESCMELFSLIKDMSSYGAEFTRAMHSLIERHLDYLNKLFKSIVMTGAPGNESFVYSMVWVQDEGIKKYFKQLPSFSLAIKGKPSLSATITSARMALSRNYFLTGVINSATTVTSSNMNSQNPAVLAARVEVEQFNVEILSKEVETLLANVSDHELEDVDIIKNFNYIELIAQLHESSDWLIIQLKGIIGALEQMVKNPKSLNSSLSLNETNRLGKLVEELEKWRGDTLLLLYLETRVHCFYHLMSFIKQENNTSYAGDLDTDPDEAVLFMNRDLHRIHEHLSRSLQEHKCAYVFEALGFLIASIFVRAIKNFKKISTHGIAKMCRNIFNVEQNLSAIRQISDPHLMKAHRFYELLYKKPEELLNHLIEHEAEFSLNDYINLLNLIYRSQPGHEINSLSDNIESLKNILKNKQH